MTLPIPANIQPQEFKALCDQCQAIYDNVVMGNKSTARAMFSQIKYNRRAYAAMYLLHIGQAAQTDKTSMVQTFIASVTS